MGPVRYYSSIFLRRLPYFLVVATIVSAVSVVLALTLPPTYVSQMRLWPVTESNQTFGEWWAEFDVEPADEVATVERVTNTFRQAFRSVSDRFGG